MTEEPATESAILIFQTKVMVGCLVGWTHSERRPRTAAFGFFSVPEYHHVGGRLRERGDDAGEAQHDHEGEEQVRAAAAASAGGGDAVTDHAETPRVVLDNTQTHKRTHSQYAGGDRATVRPFNTCDRKGALEERSQSHWYSLTFEQLISQSKGRFALHLMVISAKAT